MLMLLVVLVCQIKPSTMYCTALFCTVLYLTVLPCTVLYCTVLYYTVLYCTAGVPDQAQHDVLHPDQDVLAGGCGARPAGLGVAGRQQLPRLLLQPRLPGRAAPAGAAPPAPADHPLRHPRPQQQGRGQGSPRILPGPGGHQGGQGGSGHHRWVSGANCR